MQAHFTFRVISVTIICWNGNGYGYGYGYGYGRGHDQINKGKLEKKEDDSFCRPFPGIVLEEKKIRRFDNGSLVHNQLTFPKDSYRVFGNQTFGCVCNLRACLKKCCRRNEILGAGDRPNCTRLTNGSLGPDLILQRAQLAPEMHEIANRAIGDLFVLVENMDCPKNTVRYMLEPEKYKDDTFVLERNGTLRTATSIFSAWNYCLDWKESFQKIGVLVCLNTTGGSPPNEQETYYNIGIIISIPFFLATFLVYAIIPELRSLYGKTLMCYVACLVLAYTFLVVASLFYFAFHLCSAIAFIIHFSFLASFFWLNVMCFDIWWTFGGFRSLQGSVKQRERKKFVIYSIYAWGSATILTCICILMEYLPNIPENFIRPQFGVGSCWFGTDQARAIYFYGPMGITVFCNICLFVSTAVKIVKHKKDTANHLRGADSRRHDDNKQWFSLYLKLFIVMGISWSMEIISWLFNNSPRFIWYLTDLTNTLQGVLIFLIFVWKDKIRRLLLKKFGCHGSNVVSRNSTRSAYHSSTSRTGTSTVQTAVPTNVSSTPASATTTISAATTTLLQEKGNEPLPLQEDNLKLSEYNGHCF